MLHWTGSLPSVSSANHSYYRIISLWCVHTL